VTSGRSGVYVGQDDGRRRDRWPTMIMTGG
jgi:hypothetical protein